MSFIAPDLCFCDGTSSILSLAVDHKTKIQIQKSLPYPWAKDAIQYLGITLTNPLSQLYNSNFEPLINSFAQEMHRLKKFYLSWSGRLAAYKMLLLPKLFYYFRALPIQIPSSFYINMQLSLSKFIWEGKRARCSHNILMKHRKQGAREFQISKITIWRQCWNRLSHGSTLPIKSIKDLLLSTTLTKQLNYKHHPTITATLQAWDYFMNNKDPHVNHKKVPIPITALSFLFPDLNIQQWRNYGIRNISDLISQDRIKPFSELQSTNSLPAREFMAYARVTSILASDKAQYLAIPESIDNMWNSNPTPKKGITEFYNLLHSKLHFKTPKQLLKWEFDLNITVSQEQWSYAIKTKLYPQQMF